MRLLSIIVFTVVLISNTFGQTTPTTQVETMADLVALRIPTISNRLTAIVTKYWASQNANEGGGGIFIYDSSSSTATNLGTVFKPAASDGRWLRQFTGPLNVRWFGAFGNDGNIDTPAFTNALEVARSTLNGTVEVPLGRYRVTDIVFPSGGTITLRGTTTQYGNQDTTLKRATLVALAGTTNVLNTTSGAYSPSVTIENLTIEGSSNADTGILMTGDTTVRNVFVARCNIQGILGRELNSAVLSQVSCNNNNGFGMVITNGVSPVSTRFLIDACTFRVNARAGLAIYEGDSFNIRFTQFESNVENGLILHQPTGITLDRGSFDNLYFENNGSTATDDTRYACLIDSDVHDLTTGPPSYMTFENASFFSNNATQRSIMVRALYNGVFNNCSFIGGTEADNIQLDTWASYVVFKNRVGGSPIGGFAANFCYEEANLQSGSTGLDVDAQVSVNTLINASLTDTRVVFSGAAGLMSDAANFTFVTPTLTIPGTLTSPGQLSIQTSAAGNIVMTPNAGSAINLETSGVGNVAVNTTELVVDTAVGVGVNTSSPTSRFDVRGIASLGDQTATGGSGVNQWHHLSGTGVYDGAGNFGNYGGFILSANANFTGASRRFLVSNALSGVNFAIIRSVDATTDPSLGTNGAVTSGTADLVIDWQTGAVGIGDTSPTSGLSMGDDKLLQRDVNAAITASTTQAQGNGPLTAEINEISVVANANDTVTLPTAVAGLKIVIINNGANTLQIFPATGDNLGAGVDASTTLASASNVVYVSYDATNWESL